MKAYPAGDGFGCGSMLGLSDLLEALGPEAVRDHCAGAGQIPLAWKLPIVLFPGLERLSMTALGFLRSVGSGNSSGSSHQVNTGSSFKQLKHQESMQWA